MNIAPEIICRIDEIRNDQTHGASELARQAIMVLKTTAELSQTKTTAQFRQEQREVGERLMSVRPAMAPLFNIVTHWLEIITARAKGQDLDSAKHLAMTTADEVIRDSLQAVARIAQSGAGLVADDDRIMTHSYSSTVIATIKETFTKHRGIEVTVTRSGPRRGGEMIAQQLAAYGVPLTFIDDTAIGLYISTVSKVFVGADRICADSKLVNGIGTYPLALAARQAGIPLYVLCETLKFDPRINSAQVDLEETGIREVVAPAVLPQLVRIRNPNFDITPLELVTGIITENGLLALPAVTRYMDEHLKNKKRSRI